MPARSLCVFLMVLAVFSKWSKAQQRTYRVRGKDVRLEVDPNVILVRPEGDATLQSAGEAAIRVQSRMLNRDPQMYLEQFRGKSMQDVVPLNGVLVPRLIGLQGTQVRALHAGSEQVGLCDTVMLYGGRKVVPLGSVTVRFKTAPVESELAEFRDAFGLEAVERRPAYAQHVVQFVVKGDQADPFAVADVLSQRASVQWAEADLVHEFVLCGGGVDESRAPNDPFFGRQWYLQSGAAGISLPEAWKQSVGTDRIVVAVLDDGVDLLHEDLREKLLPGRDFYDGDNTPQPAARDSHGTACAGIVGALTDNRLGIAGIAWRCKILPVRIAGDRFVTDSAIAAALTFAAGRGARILSCSWGGGPPTNKVLDAIDAATDAGCLVVAAAGNALPAMDTFFPAWYERCIAVGSVTRDNRRWNYSCYGPGQEVDLVAPSGDVNGRGDIWSTDHSGPNGYNVGGSGTEEATGNYTAHFGGTSAATPVVAGVCALVWSTFPDLPAEDVRRAVEESATRIDKQFGGWTNGRSKQYGVGKINALNALRRAAELMGEIQAATPTATTKDIEGALDPAPASYSVRGQTVTLRPNANWIAVGLPAGDKDDRRRTALRTMLKEGTSEHAVRVSSPLQDMSLFFVPRSTLREKAELVKTARKYAAAVYPVYESTGSLVVPLGTFTCRLRKGTSEETVRTYARQHNIEIREYRGDMVRMRLVPPSTIEDLFAAVRAVNEAQFCRWCEPDFAFTLIEGTPEKRGDAKPKKEP